MPLTIRIETERCQPLSETLADLSYVLDALGGVSSDWAAYLPAIDPYGKTVFNGFQIPRLRDECWRALADLRAREEVPEGYEAFLAKLYEMMDIVERGGNRYLAMLGD